VQLVKHLDERRSRERLDGLLNFYDRAACFVASTASARSIDEWDITGRDRLGGRLHEYERAA